MKSSENMKEISFTLKILYLCGQLTNKQLGNHVTGCQVYNTTLPEVQLKLFKHHFRYKGEKKIPGSNSGPP